MFFAIITLNTTYSSLYFEIHYLVYCESTFFILLFVKTASCPIKLPTNKKISTFGHRLKNPNRKAHLVIGQIRHCLLVKKYIQTKYWAENWCKPYSLEVLEFQSKRVADWRLSRRHETLGRLSLSASKGINYIN